MTLQVLIRVDASREIGLGHLSRCMSLAGALRSFGAGVTFLMRAPDPDTARRVTAEGFGCEEIGAEIAAGSDHDAAITGGLLERLGADCVAVVDHYGIGLDWEKRVRPKVRRLAVIDDLADREHECDVLIDQNRPFDGDEAYRGLVPAGCALLTGPRFAMLRPEFAQWRARPRLRDGRVDRVLVSFGGSDPGGHTQAALRALAPFLARLERVDVVVGPLNPARAEIEALASSQRVKIHVDPPDIGELLHASDLAIGGGGVSSWERLCLSVPALAFGIVSNQTRNIRDLIRMGVAVGAPETTVPDEDLYARWLSLMLETPELLRGMAERAGAVVDGNGALRVARRLLRSHLAFRPARPEDSAIIHKWRNSPATRAVSASTAEIPFGEHERWFAASLADPTRLILIAEADGTAAGVARFDQSGDEATISVFSDPDATRPLDLVAQATRWLFDNRADIERIWATVLADNSRSALAFQAAGYRLREQRYVRDRPAPDIEAVRETRVR